MGPHQSTAFPHDNIEVKILVLSMRQLSDLQVGSVSGMRLHCQQEKDSRIVSFEQLIAIRNGCVPFVMTSMPADPLHVGHKRLLLESARLAQSLFCPFAVIVNDDKFLMRKKGYVFMPLAERMEIIAAIRGVDYVAPWSDDSQLVAKAIDRLRPSHFTKGGDRSSPAQIAPEELEACQRVGCEIVYGVGGFEKVQSSSSLVQHAAVESL